MFLRKIVVAIYLVGRTDMERNIVLNPRDLEMPDDAKISKVFDRLMKINAAVTQDGMRELYYECYHRYADAYSVSFF